MRGITLGIVASIGMTALGAGPASGSGISPATPTYLAYGGGTSAELARLFDGRLGIVMARAPKEMLFVDWRLLHGLRVGGEAGRRLASPCCDLAETPDQPPQGSYAWLTARAEIVEAEQAIFYLPTDRQGPDYMSIPNCFPDAFEVAAATLRDRAARHGRTTPAVRLWLQTQDRVFDACGGSPVALPPLPADAPAWLRADRAYQEAALALYDERNLEAAMRFAAIAEDAGSPWQPKGLYLWARALYREALLRRSPFAFASSRFAIARLAASPPDTYGRGEARRMLRALAYRDQPQALLAELDHELNLAALDDDVDLSLTDYLRLGARAEARPEAADWIFTMRSTDRAAALRHAGERWRRTGDVAWLVAALSLVGPADEPAAALMADAARVGPDHPAWLTVQYHLIRLGLATADPAESRARLDALLARPDLTLGERNLFSAARMQVAADLAELARFAVRRPYCVQAEGYCLGDWRAYGNPSLGRRGDEYVGLGADALAVIDRLPLDDRIALSRRLELPAELRLDIALTSFARAVLLQDDPAIGGLAGDLAALLPQLRDDWRTIAALRPGPARRFAIAFAMAKIPGLRTDLVPYAYTRPEGTVLEFQGHWLDWMILPRGGSAGPIDPPAPSSYLVSGFYWQDNEPDLICLGRCGGGAFPLRMPGFVAAAQDRAAHERSIFVTDPVHADGRPRPLPAGAVSIWEEALAYARAHPRDPRVPELLYRLIRVARWGGSHDHSGRRAFQLLHARYPGSVWTRRSPYYYD